MYFPKKKFQTETLKVKQKTRLKRGKGQKKIDRKNTDIWSKHNKKVARQSASILAEIT